MLEAEASGTGVPSPEEGGWRQAIAAGLGRNVSVLMAAPHRQAHDGYLRRYGMSPRTVEVHRARVMEKMEACSLSELVRMVVAGHQA